MRKKSNVPATGVMKAICLLFAAILVVTTTASAAVTLTKFTGGSFCSTYPSSYVTGSFSITEASNSSSKGFTKGQTNATLILGFSSSSFQFNPGQGTVTATGTEVTILSYTITATTITVNITTAATNTELNTINFNNVQVQATAAATGYIKRTGGTFKIDNRTTRPSGTTSWGDLAASVPMAHSSNTATQAVTSTVFSGSTNNQVIGVTVTIAGTCSSVTATAFNFNTTGSTLPLVDVANAKLYYTGTTNVFSTATLFGTATGPNGAFSITGSQSFSAAGTYYFWLTYDLNVLAVATDVIDAQLVSSTIGGSSFTPTTGNPSGSRTINTNNFYSIGAGNWSALVWSRTQGGLTCSCAPTGGSGFVYINHAISLDNSYTVDNVTVQSSGTLTNAATKILTVTGNLSTTGTGTFAATTSWVPANISTAGTGTSTTSAAISTTGSLSVGSGTTFQATGGAALSVSGSLTVNGTLALGTSNLANSGTGSILNGTGSITGSGIITLGSSKTIPTGTSLTISPVVNIPNNNTITSNGTVNMQNDITGGGNNSKWVNAAGSVLNMGGTTSALLATGDLDASATTNTVNYNGSGNQSIKTPSTSYYNLYVASSGTAAKSLGAAITVNNDVQISTGAQLNAGSNNITITGNWINNSTHATPFVSTGTVNFNGTNAVSGTGITAFNNINIGSTGILTANSSTGKVTVAGNWVNDGDFNHNSSDITFNGTTTISGASVTNFNTVIVNATKSLTLASVETDIDADLTVNGTLAHNSGLVILGGNGTTQNINGATGALSLYQLEVSTTSGTVLLSRPLSVSDALTLTSSTDVLSLNGNALTLGTAGSAAGISGSGILKGSTASDLTINGTGALGTIRFDQTTPGTTNALQNLTLNRTSSGSATLGSNLVVGNTLTLTSGAFTVGANTLTLNGPAIAGTASNLTTAATSSLVFGGSAASVAIPSSVTALTNLTISNATGVTSNSSIAVTGAMTVNGLFIPQAANVISGTGTLTGTGTVQVTKTGGTSNAAGQYTITPANITLTNLTVEYAGAAAQSADAFTYGGLKITNTSGVTLAGNATVAGVLNLNTGTLHIASNTLTLNGAVTRTSATLNGTKTSALTLGGNSTQDLAFLSPASALATLNINKTGGTATLNSGAADSLNIHTAMLFTGNTGTLNLNGKIVAFKSDATKTAYVGLVAGTLTNATNITAEQYIPARRAWRFMSGVLLGGTQTINAAWQEGQTITTVGAVLNNKAGYGTHVTGGTAANGFDQTSTNNYSIRKWTPAASGGWSVTAPATTGSLSANNGYALFIRGSRAINLTSNTPTPDVTTLRVTGSLNIGSTGFGTQAFATTSGFFLLVGNPYVAPVNFASASMVKSGIENKIWFWDPKAGTVGAYVVMDLSTNTASTTTTSYPAFTSVVQSGQAFFVRANSASASVAFAENAKTTSSVNVYRQLPLAKLAIRLEMPVATDSIVNLDGITAVFGKGFDPEVSDEDAGKLNNFTENIAFRRDTFNLAIEKRPLFAQTDTLFINMYYTKEQAYQFTINPEKIPGGLTAVLEDKFLNTSTPLSLHQATVVPFSVTSDANSTGMNRFRIVLKRAGAAFSGIENGEDWFTDARQGVKVYPNPVTDNRINVQFNKMATGKYEVTLYNGKGAALITKSVSYDGNAASYYLALNNTIAAGAYTLTVRDDLGNIKHTQTVITGK